MPDSVIDNTSNGLQPVSKLTAPSTPIKLPLFGLVAPIVLLSMALAVTSVSAGENSGSTRTLDDIGEQLFHDMRLSKNGDIACASCHSKEHAFADSRGRSHGRENLPIVRNAPSLRGLREGQPLFWDGRHLSLEKAVLDPLFSPHEHALADDEQLSTLLSTDSQYAQFVSKRHETTRAKTFVANALAAYIRSLNSKTSDYDRWQLSPSETEPNDNERLGYELFIGKAGCVRCHTTDGGRFTDDSFHAHGVAAEGLATNLPALLVKTSSMTRAERFHSAQVDPSVSALGRFLVTDRPADIGAFRTPSLRNVVVTAPYMHDGSVKSLKTAVQRELYYSAPNKGAGFGSEEHQALVAFLESLTDKPKEK